MVNSTGRANRGIKSAPSERYKLEDIYVLNPNNIGSIWSELPECLFITNPTEEALLKDINYRQRIGHAIAAGINNFVTSLPFQ